MKEIKDRFLRRKLKKSKHLEVLNLGSERMKRRELGLRLERRVMVVVLRGFGGVEMSSVNS